MYNDDGEVEYEGSQDRPEKLATFEEVEYGLERPETKDEGQDGFREFGRIDDGEENKPAFNPGYDVDAFPNVDNPK